jgi:nucleoside-diphosphate-sugar epimerase
MNIFLTGASGFIGKNFIKRIIKNKKINIFALSRKKPFKHRKVFWLRGSLKDDWSNYLKKTNILVHLAASGIKKKDSLETIFRTNVVDSFSLIQNAISSGCKKFLIASTSSEYLQNEKFIKLYSKRYPENYYGLSKSIFSDLMLSLSRKNKKCQFKLMRIFPVFGNYENYKRLFPSLKKAAISGKNFVLKNPSEVRDFNDVEFVVNYLQDHLNFKKNLKKFQIYHISSNNFMSNKSFAISIWKKFNAKGKLIFKKNKKTFITHVSSN